MAEQRYPSPPRLSRQLVQLMVEMNSQLRQYGVTITLTAPDAVEQLIRAVEPIEDEELAQLRHHLVAMASVEADKAQALPRDTPVLPVNPSPSQERGPAPVRPPVSSAAGAAEPTDPSAGQDPQGSDRGDRVSHNDSATPEAVKVFLRAIQRDRLICERCQAILTLPEPQLPATEPVDMTCTCGMPVQVEADRRRYQRKPTHLSGHYAELKRGESGAVVVENISFGGLQLRTTEDHMLVRRDWLQLQFTLDDESQSVVSAPVYVRHVEGRTIGVRFVKTDPFDPRLAAYLIR